MKVDGSLRATHIGGPTVLLEMGGWRILTDPTFDPPGRRYGFGWGSSSTKLVGPALSISDVMAVDAVLLTHDHHADNLDDAGRSLLAQIPVVVTTRSGASRLGGTTRGLEPWESLTLDAPGRAPVQVEATPCRHGPPLSRRVVGDVIGFSLTWTGQQHGAVWITGDTVLHRRLWDVADRLRVGVAFLHLGGVRFPSTGPIRYTMTIDDALRLCAKLRPHAAFPVHYEGWSHFAEGRAAIEQTLAAAAPEQREVLQWLPMGTPVAIDA